MKLTVEIARRGETASCSWRHLIIRKPEMAETWRLAEASASTRRLNAEMRRPPSAQRSNYLPVISASNGGARQKRMKSRSGVRARQRPSRQARESLNRRNSHSAGHEIDRRCAIMMKMAPVPDPIASGEREPIGGRNSNFRRRNHRRAGAAASSPNTAIRLGIAATSRSQQARGSLNGISSAQPLDGAICKAGRDHSRR